MSALDDAWIDPNTHSDDIDTAVGQYVDGEITEETLEQYLEFIYEHGEHPEQIDGDDYIASVIDKHNDIEKLCVSPSLFRSVVDKTTKGYGEASYGRATEYYVFGHQIEVAKGDFDIKVKTETAEFEY